MCRNGRGAIRPWCRSLPVINVARMLQSTQHCRLFRHQSQRIAGEEQLWRRYVSCQQCRRRGSLLPPHPLFMSPTSRPINDEKNFLFFHKKCSITAVTTWLAAVHRKTRNQTYRNDVVWSSIAHLVKLDNESTWCSRTITDGFGILGIVE